MKKQRGMTSIGWLFVISLIAFFALLVLKLVPVFMERYEIKSALQGIAKEQNAFKLKKRQIRSKFSKRLQISTSVANVDRNDLIITINDDGTKTLYVKYEAKKHFAGPFYVMAVFEEQATIPSG